jgi:hypothetical protein
MGVIRHFSASSYDEKSVQIQAVDKLPNPDPKNYVVLMSKTINDCLILRVKYPDCINYEGTKILLFDKGVTIDQLNNQGSIDPHFSNNENFISPIARFIPTRKGWYMAMNAAKNI